MKVKYTERQGSGHAMKPQLRLNDQRILPKQANGLQDIRLSFTAVSQPQAKNLRLSSTNIANPQQGIQ